MDTAHLAHQEAVAGQELQKTLNRQLLAWERKCLGWAVVVYVRLLGRCVFIAAQEQTIFSKTYAILTGKL